MLKMGRIAFICSMILLVFSGTVLAGYDVDKVFKVNVGFPWSMANAKILFKLDSKSPKGKGVLGFVSFGEKAGEQPFTMNDGPTKVNFHFKTPKGSTIKGVATITPNKRTLFVDANIISSFLPNKHFKDTYKY